MDWLTDNVLWILFGAAFFWMHLKMHGSHGSHGGHGSGGGHGGHGEPEPEPAEAERTSEATLRSRR